MIQNRRPNHDSSASNQWTATIGTPVPVASARMTWNWSSKVSSGKT